MTTRHHDAHAHDLYTTLSRTLLTDAVGLLCCIVVFRGVPYVDCKCCPCCTTCLLYHTYIWMYAMLWGLRVFTGYRSDQRYKRAPFPHIEALLIESPPLPHTSKNLVSTGDLRLLLESVCSLFTARHSICTSALRRLLE